ncbi:MAG: hypothetical protein EXQ56_10025 [Acidobacteria bacterium]|nr:hypothetical protein [Acidobacteriota bacterium]
MYIPKMTRLCQFVFVWLLGTLLASLPAAAQCVLCYNTVAGAGARTISVMRVAILILIVPTLFIFGALALMLYRRRKTPGGEISVIPAHNS